MRKLSSVYSENDFNSIKKRYHKSKPTLSHVGAIKTRKPLEEIEANLENSALLNESLPDQLLLVEEEFNKFL